MPVMPSRKVKMTRIFYEDGKREDEQPPQHHDPPLGEEDWLPVVHSNVNYWDEYTKACAKCYGTGSYLTHDLEGFVVDQLCDCHYPFDGDGWVLCDAHKEEENAST